MTEVPREAIAYGLANSRSCGMFFREPKPEEVALLMGIASQRIGIDPERESLAYKLLTCEGVWYLFIDVQPKIAEPSPTIH